MLDISRLISVQTVLTQAGAQGRLFNQLLVLGDSNIISGLQRYRQYSSLAGVAADFGTTAPEYLAAAVYFAQSPTPTNIAIGRWLRTASAAQNEGGILSTTEQAITNFQQITNGGFDITIDGTAKTITGLNFSASGNLNSVASLIQTALSGAGTCVWTGTEFIITSATTGAGVEATGNITLTGNPAANDTVTVNGVVITFVSASPTGNEVLIGSTAADTAANLWTFLFNSTNASLTPAAYSLGSSVVNVTYNSVGTAGNAFTLAKSSTNITVSGATLSGGVNASSVGYATSPASGQDVSALLKLTAATALPLVPGYDAETPLQAVTALDSASQDWYGLVFAASTMPSSSDYLACANFIEADTVTRMMGVTSEDSNILSSLSTTDIAYELKAGKYDQTFCFYSSTQPYAAATVFGLLFTINLSGSNTFIDVMYKQAPTIVAENLTDSEATALQNKNCSAYVEYDNNTSIIQYGNVASGNFIDEIYGIDALSNAVQTAYYNVLYTSTTKVPQTDAGDNQFAVAIANVCQQYVTNGFLAPGVWNAAGFGQLAQGQYLKLGYYIYMQPLSSQSESDRAARKAPPFQVAAKLAGANQTGQVLITVNQ